MHRRYIVLTTLGLGLWGAVALWIAPQLIRAGHAGESVAFVNDIFAGRDVHPVEFYLGDWWSVAFRATLVLLGGLAVSYLGIRFSDRRRSVIGWIVGGDPALDLRTFIWFGVCSSLLSGVLQALYSGVRQSIIHVPASGFRREFFWMMPVSAALAGLVVSGLVAVLARAGRSRIAVRKATLLFGFVVAYAVIQSDGIPLDARAEVILALGLAMVGVRVLTPRARGARAPC